jgi:hypothetical protein
MSDMALLIPILALSIPIVAIISKGKQKRLEMELAHRGQSSTSVEAAHLQNEIRQLKERIIVLERVITDGNSAASLDREIEKLR